MGKVIQSLKTFSPREMKAFATFLDSPYCCTHQDTRDLFGILRAYYPTFEVEGFAEYQKIYPKDNLTRARFNVIASYLLDAIHRFWVMERMKRNPELQREALVSCLQEREQYREAWNKLALADSEGIELDGTQLRHALKQRELAIDLSLSTDIAATPGHLKRMYHTLDAEYVHAGLKYLLLANTLSRIFHEEFPAQRWDGYIQMIEAAQFPLPDLTMIFFHLLHLLRGGDQLVHLPQLFALLKDNEGQIPKVELINIYGHLQNYFTQQVHKGMTGALEHLVDIYQQLDHADLIFGRGEISERLIRNITISGCRLGNLDWVTDFLNRHERKIQRSVGTDTLHYAKGYAAFYRQDYPQSLKHLTKMELKDPFYRTGHQVLLMRIYYELADWEPLIHLMGAFRRYLNRNKQFSDKQKNLNRNFLSILKKLVQARTRGRRPTPAIIRKIEEKMSSFSEITDQIWLTDKIEELK